MTMLRALGRRTSTAVRRMLDISTIDTNIHGGMPATLSSSWYSSVSVFDTYVQGLRVEFWFYP